MKITKAIIPAAGLGTRVLPASKSVPKEMLNIVDKPAIQYLVEEAAAAGITDILVITNRGKGVIEDHFDHSFELEKNLEGNPSKANLLESITKVTELANISYIRQKETKGLAHALYCAKTFAAGEPVAVLYGDDVVINEKNPAVGQLCRVYEKYGKTVVGVQSVDRDKIGLYCSLGVTPFEGESRIMACDKIIEKPKPEEVMSLFAILGRVIISPEVFELIGKGLEETPEGKELVLTDIFSYLGSQNRLLAYDFEGRRYDMGNKLGIMKANCEVALNHPEIGEDFRAYLKELVKTF